MYQLAAPVTSELEIKKSRFLGFLFPVHSRPQAMQHLQALRAAHPGAVHVCWALVCTGDSGLDDDGEPSGTAAKPMYNVLVHKDVTNILAVVVRYWGGIKLGAGGLTRAYGQTISDAFRDAQLIAVEVMQELQITVAYAAEAQVRHWLEKFQAEVLDVQYDSQTRMTVRLREKQVDTLCEALTTALKGQVTLRRIPE
ncbi:IMPACT family protein [Undibacterium luofuense]|uniref:YigZ family protein n=1 Tax=Undibacterium luofuense TaxID=2828733 RepID=A0A941DGU1_9BURK|nr:YigZ family protein [Undibacterium luofuense]MBR7780647.1 YigZ family protein [Undibacterium luofuense]